MTETRAVSIDDVRTLVAERQRYDDWLAALEARRTETPARVFERVHGDYAARRSGVIEQLRSHIGALSTLGDELDGRLSALESTLASLEDERVEAMLRTAVGEFDGERWEAVRTDVEAKIEEHNAQRTELLAEVDDVRTLLSSARSEPATPEANDAGGTAQADGVEGSAEKIVIDVADEERATESTDAPAPVAHSDVLYGEPAAVETHADENVASPAQGASAPVDHDALDLEDALALFTPSASPNGASSASMIDTSGIEVIGSEQAGTVPVRAATLTPVDAALPQASPNAQQNADPFDDLAFLRSVIDPSENGSHGRSAVPTPSSTSSEPQKTLRCTECGTMNLPTEWYCERCGGELAAF